jgi:hypothetical protein
MDPFPVLVMGKNTVRVLGPAHVKDVYYHRRLSRAGILTGKAGFHIIGSVDLTGSVNIAENADGIVGFVSLYCGPAMYFLW